MATKNTKFCDCGHPDGEGEMPLEIQPVLVDMVPIDVCDECAETVTVAQLRIIMAAKNDAANPAAKVRHGNTARNV